MIATCAICGESVVTHAAPRLIEPGPSAEQRIAFDALAKIAEFDLLAGLFSQHLEAHPAHDEEMIAVMSLAGKMFAMKHAIGFSPEFDALRASWRTGIMQMFETLVPPAQAEASAGSDSSASSPDASGSKEKKSERNFSH